MSQLSRRAGAQPGFPCPAVSPAGELFFTTYYDEGVSAVVVEWSGVKKEWMHLFFFYSTTTTNRNELDGVEAESVSHLHHPTTPALLSNRYAFAFTMDGVNRTDGRLLASPFFIAGCKAILEYRSSCCASTPLQHSFRHGVDIGLERETYPVLSSLPCWRNGMENCCCWRRKMVNVNLAGVWSWSWGGRILSQKSNLCHAYVVNAKAFMWRESVSYMGVGWIAGMNWKVAEGVRVRERAFPRTPLHYTFFDWRYYY